MSFGSSTAQNKKIDMFVRESIASQVGVSYCTLEEPRGLNPYYVKLRTRRALDGGLRHIFLRRCKEIAPTRVKRPIYVNKPVRPEKPCAELPFIWLLFLTTLFTNFLGYVFAFSFSFVTFCAIVGLLKSYYRRILRMILRQFLVVLEPQMGGIVRGIGTDRLTREAILLGTLFISLQETRSRKGMVAAITSYMQAHVNKSLPLFVYTLFTRQDYIRDWTSTSGKRTIDDMIDAAFNGSVIEKKAENGEIELVMLDTHSAAPDGVEIPWHIAVERAFSNWKDFRNGSFSTKFFNLVNVLVSAGLCSATGLDFKLGNVPLFSAVAAKKQIVAADVFEAFYEAVSCFLRGGWRVYKTGEASAFFTDDDKITEFEKLYTAIRQNHGFAIAGNLQEFTELDDNAYDKSLKDAIEIGDGLMKSIKRTQTMERKYVSDRLDKIREYDTEFTQLRTRGGLRVAPFAISLFGQSGCGKSTLTNLTLNAGLLYNNLDASKDRIATWADNDKFASTVRSHINAIIFDDFANTKEEFMDFSPAYRLIQVINNIRYLAPMADVFLKGKVSLNPYFCIVSTNVEHLNASRYSNEPESVLRRLYHVKVVPKPQFCENGILSKSKIEAHFGIVPCPDVWNITVRTYSVQNKRTVSAAAFEPIVFNGKRMENVSVFEYLKWVQEASKLHFSEEKTVIDCQAEIPVVCDKCGTFYCACKLHTIPESESEAESSYSLGLPDEMSLDSFMAKSDASEPTLADFPELDEGKLEDMRRESRIFDAQCKKYELEEHSGVAQASDEWSDTLSGYIISCYEYLSYVHIPVKVAERWANKLKDHYHTASTEATLAACEVCNWWESWDFLPESMVCHPKVLQFGLLFWRKEIKHSLLAGNSFILLMSLGFYYILPSLSILFVLVDLALCYWYTCATVQTYRILVRERMLQLRDIAKSYMNSWQLRYALFGIGVITLLLSQFRTRVESYNLQAHGGLSPECEADIKRRNDQSNPWLIVGRSPLPMSVPSKTTTADNLAGAMATNLVGVVSDVHKSTMGFYISSNFMLVPTHFIEYHGERDINVRCFRSAPGKVGSYFRDKLSVAYRHAIPGTDFTLCYVTSGGSMKDFRKFLPLNGILNKTDARLVTRGIAEDVLEAIPVFYKGSYLIAHKGGEFPGAYYDTPVQTFEGMCMSPVISNGRGSVILGFHLGGCKTETGSFMGGCGTLTLAQAEAAIMALSGKHGVVLSTSSGTVTPDLVPNMGDFPIETYKETVLKSEDIHEKSATRFLEDGACIDVYGTTSGRATPYSSVVPTMIADSVKRIFGTKTEYGPPKMKGKGVYPFQATLAHAAIPSLPLGSILEKATGCYKSITAGVKEKLPSLFDVGPLSRVAAVSGLKGVKFIDPMNFNTSPGFPLSGAKTSLLIDLDPEEYPDIGKPRTFVPEVWEEYDKTVETLRSGRRCYAIWKACLKDEVTKTTKDKVRVFQSAPLVIQLLIRTYFLPIVRIIQMNPIAFECAVGINAEGLEWQELWEAAMSKGRERVFAGDYSKYDIRMPAQVTCAAFDVLIDIAEKCDGYTESDIMLMKAIVHEVVYPVVAYNGDLIQLFGTNPSGQNLTVIINSIVNSLLLRSCFYSIYPDLDFKEQCTFMTYGDDVFGTVSALCKDFNICTYAAWLSNFDMGFTMPNKSSELREYMTEEEVEFLKRKSYHNPDLGYKVGLLSEDSIEKRLLSHMLSKELSMEMHSAENIESSLHDWFYYGRPVFEDRRDKLKAVAEENGISHLCPGLEVSYDKRVAHWRHKYLGEDLPEDDELPVLQQQCGDYYVSTVDYTDHCIGSARDIFYWWEHLLAAATLPFLCCIWYLVHRGWSFTIGRLDVRWYYLFALTGGGRSLTHMTLYFVLIVIHCFVLAYIPSFLISCFKIVVDDDYAEEVLDMFHPRTPPRRRIRKPVVPIGLSNLKDFRTPPISGLGSTE